MSYELFMSFLHDEITHFGLHIIAPEYSGLQQVDIF